MDENDSMIIYESFLFKKKQMLQDIGISRKTKIEVYLSRAP